MYADVELENFCNKGDGLAMKRKYTILGVESYSTC